MSDYDETLHILNEVQLNVLIEEDNGRMYATVDVVDPEDVCAIVCLTKHQMVLMAEFFAKAAEQMVDEELPIYN